MTPDKLEMYANGVMSSLGFVVIVVPDNGKPEVHHSLDTVGLKRVLRDLGQSRTRAFVIEGCLCSFQIDDSTGAVMLQAPLSGTEIRLVSSKESSLRVTSEWDALKMPLPDECDPSRDPD